MLAQKVRRLFLLSIRLTLEIKGIYPRSTSGARVSAMLPSSNAGCAISASVSVRILRGRIDRSQRSFFSCPTCQYLGIVHHGPIAIYKTKLVCKVHFGHSNLRILRSKWLYWSLTLSRNRTLHVALSSGLCGNITTFSAWMVAASSHLVIRQQVSKSI